MKQSIKAFLFFGLISLLNTVKAEYYYADDDVVNVKYLSHILFIWLEHIPYFDISLWPHLFWIETGHIKITSKIKFNFTYFLNEGRF